jgi:hypothetical protein
MYLFYLVCVKLYLYFMCKVIALLPLASWQIVCTFLGRQILCMCVCVCVCACQHVYGVNYLPLAPIRAVTVESMMRAHH